GEGEFALCGRDPQPVADRGLAHQHLAHTAGAAELNVEFDLVPARVATGPGGEGEIAPYPRHRRRFHGRVLPGDVPVRALVLRLGEPRVHHGPRDDAHDAV